MSEPEGRSPTGRRAQTVTQQERLARSVGGRGGHEGPEVPGPSPTSSHPYATRKTGTTPRRGLWTLPPAARHLLVDQEPRTTQRPHTYATTRVQTSSLSRERRHAWAEARIKTLTGGDRISARFMRQDLFTFTPQFKLLIAGNNLPNLRNIDTAMRRRCSTHGIRGPRGPERHTARKRRSGASCAGWA